MNAFPASWRWLFCIAIAICVATSLPNGGMANEHPTREERSLKVQRDMDARVADVRRSVVAREVSAERLLTRLASLQGLRAPGRDGVREVLDSLGEQDVRYLFREFLEIERGNAATARLKLRLASFVLERSAYADAHRDACLMKADAYFLVSSSLQSIREEISTLSRHRSLGGEDRRGLEAMVEALTKPSSPEGYEEAYRLIDLSVNHRSAYGQIQWVAESVLQAAGENGWRAVHPDRHGGDTRPIRAFARAAVESLDFSHLSKMEGSLSEIQVNGDLKAEIHYWIGIRYIYFEKYAQAITVLGVGAEVEGAGRWKALCAFRKAQAQFQNREMKASMSTLAAYRDLLELHEELATSLQSFEDSISRMLQQGVSIQ